MSKMDLTIPHNLPKNAAIERVKQALAQVKIQYASQFEKLEDSWNDNVLTFELTAQKQNIKGTLTIEDKEMKFAGEVPFMMSMMKGKIQKMINEKAGELLK